MLLFYGKARIPTQEQKRCASKLQELYHDYQNLKKKQSREGDFQRRKEMKFRESSDDLFDISHARALDTIKIDEDKQFLLIQRKKGRPGSMVGVDRTLAALDARTAARQEAEQARRDRYLEECRQLQNVSVASTSSTE